MSTSGELRSALVVAAIQPRPARICNDGGQRSQDVIGELVDIGDNHREIVRIGLCFELGDERFCGRRRIRRAECGWCAQG